MDGNKFVYLVDSSDQVEVASFDVDDKGFKFALRDNNNKKKKNEHTVHWIRLAKDYLLAGDDEEVLKLVVSYQCFIREFDPPTPSSVEDGFDPPSEDDEDA